MMLTYSKVRRKTKKICNYFETFSNQLQTNLGGYETRVEIKLDSNLTRTLLKLDSNLTQT